MSKLMQHFLALIVFMVLLTLSKIDISLASSNCSLCILEVGTASNMGEEYDFVVIGNSTLSSISLSSVQLQYFNSLGVYDSKINLSGTLLAGQTKVFVSDKIKKYNPTSSNLSYGLFSGGGSLKLIKVLTSSTIEYDTFGWGLTSLSESVSKSDDISSNHFYRKIDDSNRIVDTGNNLEDFANNKEDCTGLKLNEIQPYATDEVGGAVESWVEILISKETPYACSLVTSEGKYFTFDATGLGESGKIITLNSVYIDGVEKYLELPNPSGSLSISINSKYLSTQPVFIPSSEVDYEGMEKSQSFALVQEFGFDIWKKTYQPSPGEDNVLLKEPPVDLIGSPTACDSIMINELIPNPVGSDTSFEWLEIKNVSSQAQPLEQCLIEIESEKYYFLAGSYIGPTTVERYFNLYTEEGDEKSISLRNTDESYVSLSRIYGEEVSLLQAFVYSDAPEGMSYSKFDEGWAWTYKLTPNENNIYEINKPKPVITESKAIFASGMTGTVASTNPKTTSSSKKSTTSSKNLASVAKATTGAKTTENRDVYEEPASNPDSDNNYVFVVIGVLAILYAIYEYKTDIQNFYYKRRGNKTLSREDRQTS